MFGRKSTTCRMETDVIAAAIIVKIMLVIIGADAPDDNKRADRMDLNKPNVTVVYKQEA